MATSAGSESTTHPLNIVALSGNSGQAIPAEGSAAGSTTTTSGHPATARVFASSLVGGTTRQASAWSSYVAAPVTGSAMLSTTTSSALHQPVHSASASAPYHPVYSAPHQPVHSAPHQPVQAVHSTMYQPVHSAVTAPASVLTGYSAWPQVRTSNPQQPRQPQSAEPWNQMKRVKIKVETKSATPAAKSDKKTSSTFLVQNATEGESSLPVVRDGVALRTVPVVLRNVNRSVIPYTSQVDVPRASPARCFSRTIYFPQLKLQRYSSWKRLALCARTRARTRMARFEEMAKGVCYTTEFQTQMAARAPGYPHR
eukprot:scpid58667/ scgid12417/ 